MSSTAVVNPLYLVVMRNEEEFGLFYEDALMQTEKDVPILHPSRDIILLIKGHLYTAGKLTLQGKRLMLEQDFLPFSLLERASSMKAAGINLLRLKEIEQVLKNDPLLQNNTSLSFEQQAWLSPVSDYLRHHNLPSLEELKNSFHSAEEENPAVKKIMEQKEVQFIEELGKEQQAVIAAFHKLHGGSFILPLILAMEGCTPLEYALGTAAVHRLIPEAFDSVTHEIFLHKITRYRLEAQTALDFIQSSRPKAIQEVEEIIRRGENSDVEFKSTLRINLHTGKKDDRMVHAVLKTIAAFLNSSGGTLLIGVADDGSISGIGEDGFPNDDKFLLALYDFMKKRLGDHAASSVNAEIHSVSVKKVCVVSCSPGRQPVFYEEEDFYVRIGPGTTKLKTSKVLEYIRDRFNE